MKIKDYAKADKNKLGKENIRMWIWVCFKRCKLVLDDYKVILNTDDESNLF